MVLLVFHRNEKRLQKGLIAKRENVKCKMHNIYFKKLDLHLIIKILLKIKIKINFIKTFLFQLKLKFYSISIFFQFSLAF
jgi:hypothetical protein